MNIIITAAFLDPGRRDIFISLFPQYAPQFERIETKESTIIDQVLDHFTNPDSDNNSDEKETSLTQEQLVFQGFLTLIKNTCDPLKFENPREKIREIMRNMQWFELYIDFLP